MPLGGLGGELVKFARLLNSGTLFFTGNVGLLFGPQKLPGSFSGGVSTLKNKNVVPGPPSLFFLPVEKGLFTTYIYSHRRLTAGLFKNTVVSTWVPRASRKWERCTDIEICTHPLVGAHTCTELNVHILGPHSTPVFVDLNVLSPDHTHFADHNIQSSHTTLLKMV